MYELHGLVYAVSSRRVTQTVMQIFEFQTTFNRVSDGLNCMIYIYMYLHT